MYNINSDILENIKIGNISKDHLAKFSEVFLSKYQNFAKPLQPKTHYEMVISLKKGDSFHYKPRRLSFDQKRKVDEKIKELLDAGIIKESNSPFASPIV